MKFKLISIIIFNVFFCATTHTMSFFLSNEGTEEPISKVEQFLRRKTSIVVDQLCALTGVPGGDVKEVFSNLAKGTCKDGVNEAIDTLAMRAGAPKGSTISQILEYSVDHFLGHCFKRYIMPIMLSVMVYYMYKKISQKVTYSGSFNNSAIEKSGLIVQASCQKGFYNSNPQKTLGLFINKELMVKLEEIIKNIKKCRIKNSNQLVNNSNLLIHSSIDEKALIAVNIAQLAGLDYIKIDPISFRKFKDDVVEGSIRLFDLVKNHKSKIAIIIDKADHDIFQKEEMLQFFELINQNPHKFILIICAEDKAKLNKRVRVLTKKELEFKLPSENERFEFLKEKRDECIVLYGNRASSNF